MSTGLSVLLIALAALAAGASGFWLAARRRAPAAMAQSAVTGPAEALDELNAILQALPHAALLLDEAGRVAARNDSAAELTGAAVGKPFASGFRVPDLLNAIEQVRDGAERAEANFTVPVPVERSIEGHVAPVEAGGRRYRLVYLNDITAMVRVERMRADFVANASHELRTPLTSLSGFLETIMGPARDDPDATQRFLEIMQTQAQRMRRLIDDLLSLSRIELNEHVRPAAKADLAGIARDVVDAAQPALNRAGIRAVVTVAEGAQPVTGARDELLQIAQNLIDNAVKYGGEGGDVAVSIFPGEGGTTALSVSDRGPGIAREHIPRLTERFYRVDDAASRERGGTGLGLAIVKHILNRHRGRLEIESEPGRGSKFTVFIPVWQAGG
ncbi:MAG: ATP-binding protein [Micropepsaceae bacterium]